MVHLAVDRHSFYRPTLSPQPLRLRGVRLPSNPSPNRPPSRMRRPSLGTTCCSLAALSVVAVCGCAQTGASRNPLAWLKKPAPAAVAEAEEAPLKPAKEDTADNKKTENESGTAKVASAEPVDKPPAPAEPTTANPTESTATETAVAKPTDVGTPSGGTTHDADTLALIDEELQHATADEREKLFAEWKSLDGAMVRQVIRIRKMVREKMVRELEAAGPKSGTAIASTQSATAGPTSAGAGANGTTSEASRVLPLGANASASVETPKSETLAMADTRVEPAGMASSPSDLATGTISTVGHSATRPVTVIDTLTGAANASAPPSAPPAEPAAGDRWQSQVRGLIASAEMRADQASAAFLQGTASGSPPDDATRRHYVESQVHLRLLYLMAGEQARAMQAIPGLEASEQEFWQQLLWSVSNYFDAAAMPNRSDRFTQTVEQLRTAVARLQGDANLQLRNVAFCHKIVSFGNFERFERDEYSPGQLVLLYAEIANFKSAPQPSDGLYKTQIKSTIEIFRAGQGQPAKKMVFEPTVDLCRSHRQDYFHSYELKIPGDLTLGPHVLKLTVEDMQSGKLATYSVNFTVK